MNSKGSGSDDAAFAVLIITLVGRMEFRNAAVSTLAEGTLWVYILHVFFLRTATDALFFLWPGALAY